MEFVCDNIPFEYPHILETILGDGEKTSPRGFETLEIRGISICSRNPTKRFVNHPNRHAHPVFPIIELFWYLNGDDSPQIIRRYIPAVARYVNPSTGRFDGAYGPRLRRYGGRVDQVELVFQRLRFDNASRRAIVTLFDPLLDNNDSSLDVPCNTSLQFMIRNGRLELNTYARSQDMIRGFIYDTAEWQLLQDIVAGWLGLELGVFRLFIGSAHVYVSDIAKARRIANLDLGFDLYHGISPQRASCPLNQFDTLMHTYRELESSIQGAS